MIGYKKKIKMKCPLDNKTHKGTTVHQLCLKPETDQSLEKLETALTWQDDKAGHHAQKLRRKLSKIKNGDPAHRANKKFAGYYPLSLAAFKDNIRTMELLLGHGAKHNSTSFYTDDIILKRRLRQHFENEALLIAIKHQKLESCHYLLPNLNVNQLSAEASYTVERSYGYNHTSYEDYTYSYHLLFEALLTQNREIVQALIDKGVDPHLTAYRSLSSYAVHKPAACTPMVFMAKHKLDPLFMFWYGAKFGLDISADLVESVIKKQGSCMALIETLEKENIPIQGDLLRLLLNRNDPESLFHLFNRYLPNIKALQGNLTFEAAEQDKMNLLHYCLHYLVNFDPKSENFTFTMPETSNMSQQSRTTLLTAMSLFHYKFTDETGYSRILDQAHQSGILIKQSCPLNHFLSNLDHIKQNPKLKRILKDMLPTQDYESTDEGSFCEADDREGPPRSYTPDYKRQSSSSPKEGRAPEDLKTVQTQFDRLRLSDR